jgi:hypothetical protein
MKVFELILFGVTILQAYCAKKIIWDEQISQDRLNRRVETFNNWYNTTNPTSKVYARITDDKMRLGLFAKENIQVSSSLTAG